MKNSRILRFFSMSACFAVIIFLLSACETPQLIARPVEPSQTVEYVFPPNVSFSKNFVSATMWPAGKGMSFSISNMPWMVITYNDTEKVLSFTRNLRFATTYKVAVAIKRTQDSATVDFTPLSKEYTVMKSSIMDNSYQSIKDDELLNALSSATINFMEEMTSPYSSDAIYANFARSLRQETLGGEGMKDPVTGKIYTSGYSLPIGKSKSKASLLIKTYPYRNGSKIVVMAFFNVTPQSFVSTGSVKKFDLREPLTQIRQRIKEIIAD